MNVTPRTAVSTLAKINPRQPQTHLLHSSLLQPRRNQRPHIRQSIPVIRLAQIQFHVVQSLALRQVVVVGIAQEGGAHAPDQGLGESVEDVEGGH